MKKYLYRMTFSPFILLTIIVFNYSLFARDIDSGLVAHWTFDEIENSNVVKDVTDNGLDGIAKGGCTVKEGLGML